MYPINLVAIAASLNLILQLHMAAWGKFVVAILLCDFSEDASRFHKGKTLLFKHVFREGDTIEISCPRVVDSADYSIYPENPTKYAYVYNYRYNQSETFSYRLKKWPLKQIFGKISTEPIVQWKDEKSRDVLVIKYPRDKLLVRRLDSHLVYVCKPNGIDYESPEMRMALRYALNVVYPYADDVVETIKSTGKSAAFVEPTGIFKLDMTHIPIVTHGCGNPHGNLFLNQKRGDPDEPYESCTVDIMKNPNVGFYCDGIIHPPNCFDKLIGYHDPAKPNLAFGRLPPSIHGLHYMNYDRTRYPKPFSGSCYCKDNDTNKVKASITVTRGVTQICNIGALIFKTRILPPVDYWCDVVLHPVDTLTIIYPPIAGIYDHVPDEFENIEGVGIPGVATLLPKAPENYLMTRLFYLSGDRLRYIAYKIRDPWKGIKIAHDKLNRTITVRTTEAARHKPSLVFHYIWKYKSKKWENADTNASVQVTAVLDATYRNTKGVLL